MTERKRKFFSGRSVGQAVVAAASHYGVDPEDLAYREIEKRHGFVRTRRKAVIAVDPENLVKEGAGVESVPAERERAAEPPKEPRSERERPVGEPSREGRRERRPARGGEAGDREVRAEEGSREARGPARVEQAEAPEEAPAPEGAPTPGWWHGERVDQEEVDREPGRRVDRSEGLRRPEEQAAQPERRRQERARRPARGGDESEPRGRERRPRRREEPPARPAPPPPPPLERPAPRTERLERLEPGELEDATLDALDMLLDFVDVEAEADLFVDGDRLEVELFGPDDHILLDDEGQLLIALEHLLPRMIRGLYGDTMPVRVDCADFHFEREERLREAARRAADEVRRRGKSRTLDELDPAERRIVHLALADDPSVETESVGSGYYKRLRVVPR